MYRNIQKKIHAKKYTLMPVLIIADGLLTFAAKNNLNIALLITKTAMHNNIPSKILLTLKAIHMAAAEAPKPSLIQ